MNGLAKGAGYPAPLLQIDRATERSTTEACRDRRAAVDYDDAWLPAAAMPGA